MAENKIQHFVPKCHMKPFSLENEGSAINVYNHFGDKLISNAAVKRQCAKSYFYGKDLHLEKAFHAMEGKYGSIVNKIIRDIDSVEKAELIFLREFVFLQMNRTDASIKRQAAVRAGVDKLAHIGFEKYRKKLLDLSHEKMLAGAMRAYVGARETIQDLEVALIENKTRRDFITSDDPAIMINRVYLQRLGGRPFGTASVGVQIFMPLTPRVCLVCYDRDAYAVHNKSKHKILIKNVKDVDSLNELQFIKSQNNIYFQDWACADQIKSEFLKSKSRRPETWIKFWIGLPTYQQNGIQHYRKAESSEIAESERRVIGHNYVHLEPSRWVSVFKYRNKIVGYTNGSGVAYLRRQRVDMFKGEVFWEEELLFSSKKFDPQTMCTPA